MLAVCLVDEALQDECVSVVQRRDAEGAFLIRIGQLETVVTILLRKTWGSRTAFRQSHAIQTPRQCSPDWSCAPEAETPGDALRKAISGLTMHYRLAVREGYAPAEDWLVPRRQGQAPECKA